MIPPDLATDPDCGRPYPSPEARLAAELQPDEKLLWTGRPDPTSAALGLAPALLFGLALCAFGTFLTFLGNGPGPTAPAGPARDGPRVAFLIVVGQFPLVVGVLAALAASRAQRTAYAVTSRRALIVEPFFPSGFQVRSFAPARLASILDGDPPADDVDFEDRPRRRYRNPFRGPTAGPRHLFDVADMRPVAALIRATLPVLSGDAPPAGPSPKPPAPFDPEFAAPPPKPGAWAAGELADGEEILWSARPRASRVLVAQTPAIATAAHLIVLVPILGVIAALGKNLAILLGVVWLAVFAAWALRASLRQVLAAGSTDYALTDRRALVRMATAGGRETVESFAPADLGELLRRERPDGSGDLVFAEVFGSNRRSGPVAYRGFLGLDDVRAVEGLVRSTLIDGRRGP